MKITRRQLAGIIREELSRVSEMQVGDGDDPTTLDADDLDSMASQLRFGGNETGDEVGDGEEEQDAQPGIGGTSLEKTLADYKTNPSWFNEGKMKIERKELRQIIKEELRRVLLERDPFADLDDAIAGADEPQDTSNYPADEDEAKSIVPKMFAELEKESDAFKRLDINIKYGLMSQKNDLFIFKTKSGGTVTVTVPGYRK